MPSKGRETYFSLLAKRRKKTGRLLVLLILAIGAFAVYSYYSYSVSSGLQGIGPLGSAHIHQKAAVYIDGTRLNLASSQYQDRDNYAHFEGGDGETLHLHATGIRLQYVLRTLGLDNRGPFTVLVNGQIVDDEVNYQPLDGDRILITNSPDRAMQQWIEAFG